MPNTMHQPEETLSVQPEHEVADKRGHLTSLFCAWRLLNIGTYIDNYLAL